MNGWMCYSRPASMVWYGMVWCGMVCCGMVWYGMVWCGMVWYGMVWYGVVWCGAWCCPVCPTYVGEGHVERVACEADVELDDFRHLALLQDVMRLRVFNRDHRVPVVGDVRRDARNLMGGQRGVERTAISLNIRERTIPLPQHVCTLRSA
jgi:hypothetical protein